MIRTAAPAALAAVLLATGCAPSRVALTPEFWQDREARVGVALMPRPAPAAHRAGARGVPERGVDGGAAPALQEQLGEVDVGAFAGVRDRFVEELRTRGLSAVALAGPADAGGDAASERRVTAAARARGLDVLVLLEVRRYGTIRAYYGGVPVTEPCAYFEVQGQLVDLRTGAVRWRAWTAPEAATVRPNGGWDEPPRYPNLTAALRTAALNAGEFLWREFFDPAGETIARPEPPTAPGPAASLATADR